MSDFILVVPLLAILVLMLPPFRFHIVVAGLVGGVLAIIIGGLPIGLATGLFLEGVSRLFGIAPIILFAALAYTLARAGSMTSALELAKIAFKGKLEYIVPIMVLLSALATYASGTGAGNIIISAPLIFAAVGFVPLVVAGLGIVSAAAWSVSPAAAETAFIAEAMGMEIVDYVTYMRPYALIMWVVGVVLAYIGVRNAIKNGTLKPGVAPEDRPDVAYEIEEKELLGDPKISHWKRTIPFIVLLLFIFLSPVVNKALGTAVLTPFTTPFIVLILTAVLVKIPVNILAQDFVESGKVILGLLFMVGLFIGFTNLLTEIGTFEVIANIPGALPKAFLSVSALVIGFLIAIPAGSYTTAVLIIIVPVLKAVGLNPLLYGFLTMVVAQGAMMCPAQVSVAASSFGFRGSVTRIVENNSKVAPLAGLLVIVLAVVVSTVAGF